MASYVTPKRAAEYIFYMGLVSQSTGQFQSNPTIAIGDVKVSKDGGALANITTLPAVTPAASKMVKVTLSDTEMTADNVTLVFSDAAGAEWDEVIVNIQTSARQIDDLLPTASYTAPDNATITSIQADTNDIQTRLPAALVSGRMDASVGAMAANTLTASALAADAVTEIQTGLSTLTAAQVNTEVDTALADINLDHLVKIAVDTNFATTVHLDSVIGHLADGGTTATFDRTTDSLEALQAEHDVTQSRLPASLSGDGFMKADLKSIEDELTSGNNATLNLKQLNVYNPAGKAFDISNDAGGVPAVSVVGAQGKAVFLQSQSNFEPALSIDGNTHGVDIFGNGGDGIRVQGTNKSINAPQDIALPSGDLDDQLQTIDNLIDTEVAAIKAKTDQLTFTKAGEVDANIQSVNDTTVNGNGTTVPWGP